MVGAVTSIRPITLDRERGLVGGLVTASTSGTSVGANHWPSKRCVAFGPAVFFWFLIKALATSSKVCLPSSSTLAPMKRGGQMFRCSSTLPTKKTLGVRIQVRHWSLQCLHGLLRQLAPCCHHQREVPLCARWPLSRPRKREGRVDFTGGTGARAEWSAEIVLPRSKHRIRFEPPPTESQRYIYFGLIFLFTFRITFFNRLQTCGFWWLLAFGGFW